MKTELEIIFFYCFTFAVIYNLLSKIMASILKRKNDEIEESSERSKVNHIKAYTISEQHEEAFSKLILMLKTFNLQHTACNNEYVINGSYIWSVNQGDSPTSLAMLAKLEKQYFSPVIVITSCQIKIQPLFKSKCVFAATSRYNITSVGDAEPTEREFFFLSIGKVNDACDYIFRKILKPSVKPKYKDVDAGVINPVSWTRINTVPSIDVMANIGQHMTCFNRYGTTPGAHKHSKKTLESIRKAFHLLLDIWEMCYEKNASELLSYIGCAGANEPEHKVNIFTVNFDEGFFAEGKSTRMATKKGSILEMPHFLRNSPTFTDKITLDLGETPEEKKQINEFLNNSAHICVALKIFNLVRMNELSDEINIDRGLFSRIYFQMFEELNSDIVRPGAIFEKFYGPMALYYDMIQANFFAPIKVNFCHQFWMNSMRDSQFSWRQDSIRDYERALYPTREIEMEHRMKAYMLMYFYMPSVINCFTNEEMNEEFKGDILCDFTMTPCQNIISKNTDLFMLKGDFLRENSFINFVKNFYAHKLLTFAASNTNL
jgi:hypothetical protein